MLQKTNGDGKAGELTFYDKMYRICIDFFTFNMNWYEMQWIGLKLYHFLWSTI